MKLLIPFVVFALYTSLCGQLQSFLEPSYPQNSFLSDNPCELPCVYDIYVGMSFADARAIIEDQFATENIHALENDNLSVCMNSSHDGCDITMNFTIDSSTNTVSQILLIFSSHLLFCDELYQRLGSPSLFYEIEDTTNFGTITSYLMFYDKSDIEVVLVPSTDSSQPTWIETIWIRSHSEYEQRRTALLAEYEQYLRNFDHIEVCLEP